MSLDRSQPPFAVPISPQSTAIHQNQPPFFWNGLHTEAGHVVVAHGCPWVMNQLQVLHIILRGLLAAKVQSCLGHAVVKALPKHSSPRLFVSLEPLSVVKINT